MRLDLNVETDYFTINNKFLEIGKIKKDDIKDLRELEKTEKIREKIKDILERYNTKSKVDVLTKKELNRIGVLILDMIRGEKK